MELGNLYAWRFLKNENSGFIARMQNKQYCIILVGKHQNRWILGVLPRLKICRQTVKQILGGVEEGAMLKAELGLRKKEKEVIALCFTFPITRHPPPGAGSTLPKLLTPDLSPATLDQIRVALVSWLSPRTLSPAALQRDWAEQRAFSMVWDDCDTTWVTIESRLSQLNFPDHTSTRNHTISSIIVKQNNLKNIWIWRTKARILRIVLIYLSGFIIPNYRTKSTFNFWAPYTIVIVFRVQSLQSEWILTKAYRLSVHSNTAASVLTEVVLFVSLMSIFRKTFDFHSRFLDVEFLYSKYFCLKHIEQFFSKIKQYLVFKWLKVSFSLIGMIFS